MTPSSQFGTEEWWRNSYYYASTIPRMMSGWGRSWFWIIPFSFDLATLQVTGHSLGASMASLAASHIISSRYIDGNYVRLITFGQPRTGDRPFADAHDKQVPLRFILSIENKGLYHPHRTISSTINSFRCIIPIAWFMAETSYRIYHPWTWKDTIITIPRWAYQPLNLLWSRTRLIAAGT